MPDLIDQIAKFDPGSQPVAPSPGGGIYDQMAKFDPAVVKTAAEAIIPKGDPRRLRGPISRKGPGAGLMTLFEAAFVEDPETVKRIYAKAEFPGEPVEESMKRYSFRGNDLVFKNRLGRNEAVHPDRFASKLKSLLAGTVANSPAIVLSILGLGVAQLPGAMVGGGAGEAIRKFVAHVIFKEPFDPVDDALGVATEMALTAVGEKGSRVFTGAINRSLGAGLPSGRRLGKVARGDMAIMTKAERKAAKAGPLRIVKPLADVEEMERYQALAKQFNIELSTPEIAGNRALINRFSLLGDLSQSADLIQEFKKTQNLQIQNAVPRFLDTLAEEKDPFRVGKELSDAANNAIRRLDKLRARNVSPYYKKAFTEAEGIPINNEISIELIDDLLSSLPSKTPSFNALNKIKNSIVEAEGGLVILDRIKRDTIDEILNKAKASPTIKREMKLVKDAMLKEMDEAVPSYAVARFVHHIHASPAQSAREGLIGSLANLSDTNIAGAATQMLASRNTSPYMIKGVKNLIQKENPGAWNNALRDFIQFRFENLKDSQITETSNIGGALRKAVFGNEKQRNIMKAAMSPEQYKNLEDFMTVLKRSGLTFTSESATATRQMELKALERETQMELLTVATSPFRTPERTIADRVNALRFGRGARQLAEMILDPAAGEQLKQIKRLSPKSEELIRQLGVFIGLEAPEVRKAFPEQPTE